MVWCFLRNLLILLTLVNAGCSTSPRMSQAYMESGFRGGYIPISGDCQKMGMTRIQHTLIQNNQETMPIRILHQTGGFLWIRVYSKMDHPKFWKLEQLDQNSQKEKIMRITFGSSVDGTGLTSCEFKQVDPE